ncbi:MAG TPA: ABC transporter permease, partial [Thermoanaerobaculia bacterium]|nr:ABC transporter permease [Thermoanaerobaculia bacterium]
MREPATARPGLLAYRVGSLKELTRARILEFVREPEAIFWVFVFPVLLAVALGIAFREPATADPAAAAVGGGGAGGSGASGGAPSGRYIDFLIPGLIGLNLMGSSIWGVGFAVVQTRVRKLLKRFAASPMRRSDYLLALVLSRLVFLGLELLALLAAGYFLFHVTVEGSIGALLAVTLVGALSFTGVALLVAARPTTVEAASGWMNFVMLPMWILSGSIFSYDRFPEAVHPAIRALPLTALNDALRAVMNEGASFASTWAELGVLAVWGVLG